MSASIEELRAAVDWHREYNRDWDSSPNRYEEAGILGWGKSRRLGIYREGRVKAYIGLQHVDTTKRGWNIADESHTRFFVSLFVDNRVITLRTFPNMDAALDFLLSAVAQIA